MYTKYTTYTNYTKRLMVSTQVDLGGENSEPLDFDPAHHGRNDDL